VPDEKGNTGRASLMALAERGGDRAAHYAAELAGPGCPAGALHVWGWFLELNRRRPAGGMGPGSIGHQDILAWCRLRGIRLAPWELDALDDVEMAWMQAQAKGLKRGA
jgi:hypothetical protein